MNHFRAEARGFAPFTFTLTLVLYLVTLTRAGFSSFSFSLSLFTITPVWQTTVPSVVWSQTYFNNNSTR